MQKRFLEASEAPAAAGGYAQAVEVRGASRVVYVSGQVPLDRDGRLPDGFAAQCRQAWANVVAQLAAADMTVANLIKVTTFLSDRRHAAENRAIRSEVLAGHTPALTVIVTGIFDEAWLVEIEAIAAA